MSSDDDNQPTDRPPDGPERPAGVEPGLQGPELARAVLDAEAEELPPFWGALAEMGWLGLHVDEAYTGEGYGIPTEGMGEAVKMLAREEGILLDPVYSGKAMAGMIDLIRKGEIKSGERVVFLHTGGVPALFAHAAALAAG